MSTIVGRGSGMPAGIPDFRPLNPYGRAMPKPTRPYRAEKHALYQVFAERPDGSEIPVGPKWHRDMADQIAADLNKGVLVGHIKWARNARVVLAKSAEKRDTRTIRELLMEK